MIRETSLANPRNTVLIPMVVEQSGCGERGYDRFDWVSVGVEL